MLTQKKASSTEIQLQEGMKLKMKRKEIAKDLRGLFFMIQCFLVAKIILQIALLLQFKPKLVYGD